MQDSKEASSTPPKEKKASSLFLKKKIEKKVIALALLTLKFCPSRSKNYLKNVVCVFVFIFMAYSLFVFG